MDKTIKFREHNTSNLIIFIGPWTNLKFGINCFYYFETKHS